MAELVSVACAIAAALLTAEPRAKLMAARKLERDWRAGRLAFAFDCTMPDRPARPDAPVLLAPTKMPHRRKGGSLANRIAMIHAFAHIEFAAIDLALDAAGRFGAAMPPDFTGDWLAVAADEAMHFALLDRRLRQLGSHYGALPAHDGLWQAAAETAHDLAARLAVVPMVLEARGLDVGPAAIARFANTGDAASAAIMTRIYHDEIRHVGVGAKWFAAVADSRGENAVTLWRDKVARHFRGALKPPFNDSARETAGLPREYYAGVASLTTSRQ